MPAESVQRTRMVFVHRTHPGVTLHPMRVAIVPSTTLAPGHIIRLARANLPMRETSRNQPFQSPTNFPDFKAATRRGIGRLSLAAETRSTIRLPLGATALTANHRSIHGTIRCVATAIKAVSSAVAAIMPLGVRGLADKPRSSVTEAGPVTAGAADSEVVEVAGSEVAEVEAAFMAEAEGVVVAGETPHEMMINSRVMPLTAKPGSYCMSTFAESDHSAPTCGSPTTRLAGLLVVFLCALPLPLAAQEQRVLDGSRRPQGGLRASAVRER